VVPDGQTAPYGQTYNTQIVQMDDAFHIQAAYTIPKAILDRSKPMSNSGGSWGPRRAAVAHRPRPRRGLRDGPPKAGAELRWIATVKLPGVEGQGIAWDLTDRHPTLWAIKRSTKQVLQFDVPYRRTEHGRLADQPAGPLRAVAAAAPRPS
jgi:hypothetical protein